MRGIIRAFPGHMIAFVGAGSTHQRTVSMQGRASYAWSAEAVSCTHATSPSNSTLITVSQSLHAVHFQSCRRRSMVQTNACKDTQLAAFAGEDSCRLQRQEGHMAAW